MILNMEKLNDENIKTKEISQNNGVYKIYLMKDNTINPIKIVRILRNDDSGLIYIGAAEKTTLQYRLKCFINSKNPNYKQRNHSAGVKIKNNKNLLSFINNNELFFEVIICKKAMDEERTQLENYRNEFGELPPLNG